MSRHLTDLQKQEIVDLYASGVSCRQIAKRMGYSTVPIRAALNHAGVKIKSSISTSRIHSLNDDYFSSIDCHKKAYWLGWLMSDGTVSGPEQRGKFVRIGLQDSDKFILEELKKDIGSSANIRPQIQSINGKKFPQNILTVCSAKMHSDLAKYGVVLAKSKINSCPQNIPDEFISSFILGEFEGDGCIYLTKHGGGKFSIWDNQCVCSFVQKWISQKLGRKIGKVSKKKDANVYYFEVAKYQDILDIYRLIYLSKGFDFCLKRKQAKFEELFKKWDAKQIEKENKKSSKYIGVNRVKYGKKIKYMARIQVNNKLFVAGYFDDEHQAALARDKLALTKLGNSAILNLE